MSIQKCLELPLLFPLPSSPPLPDYYILIIIEWTISPEITFTVYVAEKGWIQISEEKVF